MCMQEKLVFSTNTRMLKNCSFLNNEFSSLCELFIDNKLSMHFGKDKIKSILFSKARGLREINISATFWLSMFLVVFSFKEKFKTQTYVFVFA